MITSACIMMATLFCYLPPGHAQQAEALSEPASGLTKERPCAGNDTACLLALLADETGNIGEQNWRDQTYRELAKLLTHERQFDRALALITKITNPDTKAMTIRGIGMAAADLELTQETQNNLFQRLRAEAENIDHPPSYGIALTYISMAQAFAGDNQGAMATAADLENEALRNKAYGEAAEIQAARGEIDAVMASLTAVNADAYRDKSCRLISNIFADNGNYDNALQVQALIKNPYQRSQALLYMLEKQIIPKEIVTP